MNSIPPNLIDAINRGNCVAFVGAGFSGPARLPNWSTLLKQLAETEGVDPELHRHVVELVDDPAVSAHALDQAAQMIADHIQPPRFVARMRDLLVRSELPAAMIQRLQWIREIPFRAILTTNFDGILSQGRAPDGAGYRQVLRDERQHWWKSAFWSALGAPTIHLHGHLGSANKDPGIVFTREDYRRRLYSDPAYVTFLRSLFSTSTILYLGFSFTDAYLNELRSEILSLLGFSSNDRPVAYAILNDVKPLTQRHFLHHEGIEVLAYDSKDPPAFAGFDQILQAIHDATSPRGRFGALLAGKRILWMDPNRDNNLLGVRFLEEAARLHNRGFDPVVTADDPAAAIAQLTEAQANGSVFDLVITYWGAADATGAAPGAALLTGMRANDLRAPVLVFASQRDADARKRLALALGAQGYCFHFETLFRRIEEIFAPAMTTW